MLHKNILVAGGNGNVGRVVTELLTRIPNHNFKVIALDVNEQRQPPVADRYIQTPTDGDEAALEKIMKDNNVGMVIAMVPPKKVKSYATAAANVGAHYLDPTEVVETRKTIAELAKAHPNQRFVPHCGLAPGMVGIIASHMAKGFDHIFDMQMAVGALSDVPKGPFHHGSTWSVAGLLEECSKPCEVLHRGGRALVAPLQNHGQVRVKDKDYEAITTSGGLATMTETFRQKVDHMRYLSLRYPGHCKALLEWLKGFGSLDRTKGPVYYNYEAALKAVEDDPTLFPPSTEDHVVMNITMMGRKNGRQKTEQFEADFSPLTRLDGKPTFVTALQWTTAAGIAGMAELIMNGKLDSLPRGKIIKQEDISLPEFLHTASGSLYANQHEQLKAMQQAELNVPAKRLGSARR